MKDSRALDQEDRKEILKAVEDSSCNKIIVTHGTYTMPDTARYLKANLKRDNQTLVLTASMIPINVNTLDVNTLGVQLGLHPRIFIPFSSRSTIVNIKWLKCNVTG